METNPFAIALVPSGWMERFAMITPITTTPARARSEVGRMADQPALLVVAIGLTQRCQAHTPTMPTPTPTKNEPFMTLAPYRGRDHQR